MKKGARVLLCVLIIVATLLILFLAGRNPVYETNDIHDYGIVKGNYDNEAACRYTVPDYWSIGEVYERLIEDSYTDENIVEGIWQVYHSWIDEHISDYNTDFYYQPRDYIAACYEEGVVL